MVRGSVTALVVALGWLAAAPPAGAARPELKLCRTECQQEKITCVALAKAHLQTLLGACVGTGTERRHCRGLAKHTAKLERNGCGTRLAECRGCCNTGVPHCIRSSTTTTSTIVSVTTTAPPSTLPTTTTVPAGPTTTTLPPGCHYPSTGQTSCWDKTGKPIECAGTGQDGDVRAGAPLSYTDNGNGTITDNNTGLVWEKLTYDGGIHDAYETYKWVDAFAKIAALNASTFAGHADWRLPNVKELLSIANYQFTSPAISPTFDRDCDFGCDGIACSCATSNNTWTSTSSVSLPSSAWSVWFSTGFSGVGGKQALYAVRAVRGDTDCLPATGQTTCWDAAGTDIPCAGTGQDGDVRAGKPLSFTDNGDGTVTDDNTHLTWEKQSADHTIHNAGQGYEWDDIFTMHTATLNGDAFAGHSDWRVPNLREYQGIVDYSQYQPAAPDAFDDDCTPQCTVLTCSCSTSFTYWSSTTNAGGPGEAWYELYRRGDVSTLSKYGTNVVRAVRGGL